MDIYNCGSRPTRRGPAESFTGTVWQEPIIEARRRRGCAPAWCASSPVRAPPGIRTRSARHCSSSPAPDAYKAGAAKYARSKRATLSGFRQTRNIGTAPRRPRAWFMSPPKRRSRASTSPGWSTSATSNIKRQLAASAYSRTVGTGFRNKIMRKHESRHAL